MMPLRNSMDPSKLDGDDPARPKPGSGPSLFGGQPPKAVNNPVGGLGERLPTAPTGPFAARPNSFKNGGKVEKTGLALVHEGEHIVPADKHDEHPKHNVSLYRVIHHMNKGGLHRALNIPEGEKIPADKLEAASHSSNEHIRHMAGFAHTLEGFHHGKK